MKNDKDKSNTYLAVIPVASLPPRMPVFAAALEQVLKLFGRHLQVVCVTPTTNSYWWNGPKSTSEPSRKIAQEAADIGFAGLFLVADDSELPAGLMCWLEFFPDLKDNTINVNQLLTCLVSHAKKPILVMTNGSDSFAAFHESLCKHVLGILIHGQNIRDSQCKGERT